MIPTLVEILHQQSNRTRGGDLDTAGLGITFGNNEKAKFGTGGEFGNISRIRDSFIDDVGTDSLIRSQQHLEFSQQH